MEDIRKYEILCEQEETLIFDSFNNEDAWKLGCMLKDRADKEDLPVAIDITVNGCQLFRFARAGSSKYNDLWLRRKINSVTMMQRSTLRIHYMMRTGQEDIFGNGHLDPAEFSIMGGGFPICINGTGVIGVVSVSGLEHHEDHNVIVSTLCEFLGKKAELIHAD